METNRKLLLALGVVWLLSGAAMLGTGYWAALSSFGVSEAAFRAFAGLLLISGMALVIGVMLRSA